MPTWPVIQKVLEALYYVSGIAVAVLAAFGLKQLRLAKRGIAQNADIAKMSARRDSYKLAAEQCQVYLAKIIPLLNVLDEKLEKNNLSELLGSFSVVVSRHGISINPPKGLQKSPLDPKLLTSEVVLALCDAANSLEAFAVLFTHGVAAETVGFSSVGQTFCYTVQKYAPIIIPISSDSHYQNLLQLFQLWQIRVEEKKLLQQRDEIIHRLTETQTVEIKPLGT